MGDQAFAFVPMQGTGIYRPTPCHTDTQRQGEHPGLTSHYTGMEGNQQRNGENELPASHLFVLKTAAPPSSLTLQAPLPSAPAQRLPQSRGYREKLLVKINDASAIRSNQLLAAAGTFCRQRSSSRLSRHRVIAFGFQMQRDSPSTGHPGYRLKPGCAVPASALSVS